MAASLNEQLLEAFAEESSEILKQVAVEIVALEEADVQAQKDSVQRLMRRLHTLKGAASAMGMLSLRDVAHAAEDFVTALDPDKALITATEIDRIQDGLNLLKRGVAGEDVDAEAFRGQILGPSEKAPGAAVPAVTAAAPAASAAATAAVPPPSDPKYAGEPPSTTQTGSEKRPERGPARETEDTIRVSLAKLDALQGSIGELIVLGLQQSEVREHVAAVRNDVNGMAKNWRGIATVVREHKDAIPGAEWASLEERLARFSSRINALSRQLFQLTNRAAENVGHLGVLSDSLEDGLRGVRMLPAQPFFESFALPARDAARGQGKRVKLSCESGGIEVDRLVLDGLREPLLHLIRNAVAHGIESPEGRRAAGKDEVGAIELSGEVSGETVVITVSDDGAGVDRSAVATRARELGVSNEEHPDDQELLRMLAHPGLSSARELDELSGRGVGMDVVVGQILDLRGSVRLETSAERGTKFVLNVPVQVTTTQGLVLQVGPHRFGVALTSVDRMLRVDDTMVKTIKGVDVLSVDGDPVAITDLATLVGCPEHAPSMRGEKRQVAILRNGNARLAVILDDVPGEMPLVLRPLGRPFREKGHLAGGAIQADGTVLPVLEPRYLMDMAAGGRGRPRPRAEVGSDAPDDEASQRAGPATLLVVDDSITMRSLQRSILENAGYLVIVASDGEEALRLLRLESQIDAIVTDLEMPRVDGIELCKRVREIHGPDMPVIMMTSRGAEEDQRAGVEAGADAYIVKGDFRQEHFLATVERFVGRD